MKLLELTGIKSRFASKTPQQAIDLLRKDFDAGTGKLKAIANGANAVVLSDGGSTVWKFWFDDTAYEHFANYAIKHPSKFLPKFKSAIRKVPKLINNRDVKYVKMEKLSPFNYDARHISIWQAGAPERQRLYPNGEDKEIWYDSDITVTIQALFSGADRGDELHSVLHKVLTNYFKNSQAIHKIPFLGSREPDNNIMARVNPDVVEIYKILTDLKQELGDDVRFDYKENNMALRGRQPVILDPVFFVDDIKKNDLENIRDLLILNY